MATKDTHAALIRCRRLACAAMIAKGELPEPRIFARAGLPVLVRAADLAAPALDLDEIGRREVAAKVARYAGPLF